MQKRHIFAIGLMLCGLSLALSSFEVRASDSGTWQKHVYSFAFMGFTTTYSCDGLADKVRVLLLASGARSDAKSRGGACASGFGQPDRFARAELTFYTLVPDSSESSADPTAVAGVWREVAIAERSPRELGVGDCELVEQFKQNVVPLLSTRNLTSNTTCIPNQNSGSTIGLTFESFFAVTPPKHLPK